MPDCDPLVGVVLGNIRSWQIVGSYFLCQHNGEETTSGTATEIPAIQP
jgi:hypothetical protein